MFTYSQLGMKEYCGVHLNLMEVVPVYFVMYSVDVKVIMYLLKNRALRDGATDDPCVRNYDLRNHSPMTSAIFLGIFDICTPSLSAFHAFYASNQ